jgi:hypothetical protein
MKKEMISTLALLAIVLISGCVEPEKPKTVSADACFVVTSSTPNYLKGVAAADYMAGNYGDAYGFLLQGIKEQNYTVRVMGDYYNLSGCDLLVVLRFDEEKSTAASIRNFVCSGGKAFVLWPGDSALVSEFGMNMTDSKGLPIVNVVSQHPAAKGVSRVYIQGIQGISGGTGIISKGDIPVIAEGSCGSGKEVISASNAFNNRNIARYDNARLALQIVKYLANDSTQVKIPEFPKPQDEMVAYYNSVGSVGDAIKTVSQDPGSNGKTMLAWWDYGTTIESYNMKAVADYASPAALPVMTEFFDVPRLLQAQVAGELGYNLSSDDAMRDLAVMHATTNESEALDIVKRNNATYIMFSSELEEKFGAVAYLYCYFNNQTEKDSVGGSDCEILKKIETIQFKKQLGDEDFCNLTETGGKILIKAYSQYNFSGSMEQYCLDFGEENASSMALYSANGIKMDALALKSTVSYDPKYYYLNVLYSSDSPDRRGEYYDTIYYKGLYESLPASMNATLIYNKTIDGVLTKVYKIG